MWYGICLVVGFVGGVITTLIVGSKNRQKANTVMDRTSAVERALKGEGDSAVK